MKMRLNIYLFVALFLIMLYTDICISDSAKPKSTNLRSNFSECNGNATIAECIAGDDEELEELMMESEVSRRVLAGQPNKLAYRALQKPPVCNAQIYGNCIVPVNKDNRPCALYNRCKRNVR